MSVPRFRFIRLMPAGWGLLNKQGTGNFLHKSSVIQKCLEFVETDMDVPITSVCKAGVNVFCSVVIGEARGTGSAVSILAGLDAPPPTILVITHKFRRQLREACRLRLRQCNRGASLWDCGPDGGDLWVITEPDHLRLCGYATNRLRD